MQLKTSCPKCDASLSVTADLVGKSVKCPRCQEKFIVDDVRSPTSDQSIEDGAAAVETAADSATAVSAADGKSSAASSPSMKMLGRFELRKVLGQGGFGRVYQAYDPQLDRLLALKVPTFGPQDGKKAKRFQSEAKAAAQLRHPNIVPTFESGKIGNQFFIASQFIDGEPMSAITKAGRTKGVQAARWVSKIARALAYAHEMEIVHRDVKPQNVMLDERGEPQLMDFGLAKRLNDDSGMTADGALLGTPAYMAPEQARGDMEHVGPHSDQYALGAMLYELLTGQRAFNGAPHVVMTKILSADPPAPRSLVSQIPRDLEAITQKAMSKEISGRYASCAEFADDLDRWLAGDPTVARPMTPRERLTRWAKRNRNAALALGSIMAAFVLVGVMGITFAGHQAYASRQVSLAAERVEDEKQKALEALDKAKTERDRADQEKLVAEEQRQTASKQRAIAEQHQAEAEQERELARKAAETNRQIAYSAHMNLCQQAWDEGGIGFLQELLERYLPQPGQSDLRSFEWYYWWRMSHGYRKKIERIGGDLYVIAVSPDGNQLATVSEDNHSIIKLWNSSTGALQEILRGHTATINCLTYTADGKFLVSGSSDATVRFWSMESNQVQKTYSDPTGAVESVRLLPDGQMLVSAGAAISIWDLKTDQAKTIGKSQFPSRPNGYSGFMKISPDGQRLGVRVGGAVDIWDISSGKSLKTIKGVVDSDTAGAISFSPDGKKIAIGWSDNSVHLVDIKTWAKIRQCVGHTNHIFDLDFSPDGKMIASAGRDLTVRLWDSGTGDLISTLKGHAGRISTLTFSPNSQLLASGGRDEAIVLWDVPSRNQMKSTELPHGASVLSMAFSPDGRMFVSAGADYKASSSLVRLWNLDEISEIKNFPHPGCVTVSVISPNGALLATSCNDQVVRLWDLSSLAQITTFTTTTHPICRCLAFSPDGRLLAAGGEKGSVNLWDVASDMRKISLQGDGPLATAAAFSPDGEFLVAGSNGSVKVWRVTDGERLLNLQGHRDSVWSVAFSLDGKTIASASRDSTVKLWDFTTGILRTTLRSHTDTVQWLAFFPDGKTLATTGGDRTVKLWDVATGELKSTLTGLPNYTYSLAISTDGRTMATGSLGGSVRLWHTATDADVAAQRSNR